MDRRTFLKGLATAAVVSQLPFSGHYTLDDCTIEWAETLFDYGNHRGIAISMTLPGGDRRRMAARIPHKSGMANESPYIELKESAKKMLLEWAEEQL